MLGISAIVLVPFCVVFYFDATCKDFRLLPHSYLPVEGVEIVALSLCPSKRCIVILVCLHKRLFKYSLCLLRLAYLYSSSSLVISRSTKLQQDEYWVMN